MPTLPIIAARFNLLLTAEESGKVTRAGQEETRKAKAEMGGKM